MTPRPSFPLWLGAAALLIAAGAGAAQATSPADRDWQEMRDLGLVEPGIPLDFRADADLALEAAWAPLRAAAAPAAIRSLANVERREWFEGQARLLQEKAMAFYSSHPGDARRWIGVWWMSQRRPRFISGFGPKIGKDYYDIIVDQTAAATWHKTLAGLTATMLVADDLPAEVRESAAAQIIGHDLVELLRGRMTAPERVNHLGKRIRDHAAAFPASEYPASMVQAYLYGMELATGLEMARAACPAFLESQNPAVVTLAREKMEVYQLTLTPVELAFVALDGRLVDLARLRGKVVLLDFWATWCGPCMAEMPMIRRLHEEYQTHGLEVIGISCDVAPAPGLSDYWTKVARTADEVLAFTQQERMPWPQHYVGRKHNEGGNPLAQKFHVKGIPAKFLLDRNGLIVSINPPKEKLEGEVRRLLGL